MRWSDGFIAVDWGTTNRRAYLIGGDGRPQAEFDDDLGALRVPRGGFPTAAADLRTRLGDLPLLLAGMAGSTRGWIDAPYVSTPVDIDALVASLVWAEPDRCAIVPGVSFADDSRADIMRGEEVQVLGALAAGSIPADCTVCHPGTHAKWVRVEGGRITAFRTVMTGELFSLLKCESILSEHLRGDSGNGPAFQDGVRRGLATTTPIAEIFSVRARILLGRLPAADAAPFLSGLLIGADVRAGTAETGSQELYVMGSKQLTALYSTALTEAGRTPIEIDGGAAFIAGATRIAERLP